MQFNALVFTAVMAVLANAELSGTGVVFAAGGCSGSGNSIDFSTTTGPPFCAQFPAGAVSLELATITPGCTVAVYQSDLCFTSPSNATIVFTSATAPGCFQLNTPFLSYNSFCN